MIDQFTPFADRVLIRRDEAPENSAGGVILVASETRPHTGTVLAVGPDATETGVEVGHEVYFSQYAGTEITLDNEELLILHTSDLFGYLDARVR